LFAPFPSRSPRPTSKSHLARARGRCPAESEWRATRETARLERVSPYGRKNSNHISNSIATSIHESVQPSATPPPTCVLPRNVAHILKWAWLVPAIQRIPLPPDDRLIDNSILPAIRRLPSFVDRRPALLAFFFPVPGTRPSPHGTLYSLAACRCHSSFACLLQPF
jgi:hypothetical protein